MTTADLHTLTGAYALHALPGDEREAFERHLADCEACAQEVAEFTATAARLGLAVSGPVRPALRERVLHRVSAVRQEAPPTSPTARSARAVLGSRRLSRWALAACVAAVAALGGTTVWQHDRAEDARAEARASAQRADELAAVLAAPDARTRSAALADGARGSVVVSKSRDRAVFVASGMAAPPRGKVYQLWFDDGGTMRSAGLMDPHRASQTVMMEGAVDGASAMGITVEPRGGSQKPTSAPLALMNLPA
ncbi:anti-sigma factor domain-containing protein [Streptomyces sp. NPDC086766]|uniref:anti-sigma factor n=1 Tax=Streptomyces sp. NPDC086766 TaxID=3365754 RepID=UPI00380D7361